MRLFKFKVIFPKTFVDQGNRLIKKVQQHFPNKSYNVCARSTFNKRNGIDLLFNLCIPNLNGIMLGLQHR